jgi:hypothetical protein
MNDCIYGWISSLTRLFVLLFMLVSMFLYLQGLKAVVPSPVLKSCLDDMALDGLNNAGCGFADSDDEGVSTKATAKPKKESGDSFAGSLMFKGSKNPSTSLYYSDQNKLPNNGNGLERDVRDDLYSKIAQQKAEMEMLGTKLKVMKSETTTLLGQPTNEEAVTRLLTEESTLAEIVEQAEEARKLQVNENYKKQVKRRIDNMTAEWRKRRRLCMDFLIVMEESTDGTISMKKCMSGDGQIDIDSDEGVAKAAVSYTKQKRNNPKKRGIGGRTIVSNKAGGGGAAGSGLVADENFVGVLLNSQGCVKRVYVDEE